MGFAGSQYHQGPGPLYINDPLKPFSQNPTVYSNTEQSYTNTCPPGTTGAPIVVTVPAGTFTSTISQEFVDAEALASAIEQAAAQRALFPCTGWTPFVPGGPYQYLDASQETYSDGATHFTWHDQSGNSRFAFSSSFVSPVFRTNQQNGLSTISFGGSGSNQAFDTNDSFASTLMPVTFAFVLSIPDYVGLKTISGVFRPTTGTGQVNVYVNLNHMYVDNTLSLSATGIATVPTNSYHSLIFRLSATTWEFFLDGNDAGHGTWIWPSAAGTFPLQYIGSQPGTPFINYFKGNMGEYIIWDKLLTDVDLGNLFVYFRSKWATP